MEKLESTFSNIETRESILRNFYSTTQFGNESITTYASRLEEIYTQAVNLKGLKKSDDDILKQVLFQGLIPKIKHLAAYKCDTITDYDRFKIELRKIESELKLETEGTTKKCNAAMNSREYTKGSSESTEMKDLLTKLSNRIDNLEKEKHEWFQHPSQQSYRSYDTPGGRYVNRGFRGNSRGLERPGFRRGRGAMGPRLTRPTGSNTFMPTCYNCGGRGHIARRCPNNGPSYPNE